ncbi:tRNA (guanosine(37)-N1)-methyltransferase TrmD, partial [Acidimicrobiaceae bacterium]|nr:tRNA (guanosine(37)-N1)-methyltransferase TrmD [Acidimicrobiaceae bacterium]
KYESFVNDKYDHPTYTRPEVYKGLKVPDVLLSGDHKKIDEWKKNNLKDI